jgi:twitching motility protein PilT
MHIQDILQDTLKHNASDLFLATGNIPSIKKHGKIIPLETYSTLTKEDMEVVLLQTLSEKQKMLFEKNLEIDYSVDYENIGRFRVNAYVHKNGIGAAFRTIPSSPPAFDDLDLPDQIKEYILNKRKGLILLTGPMGSGKTTTLASLVNEINKTKERHIVTIEDPIEYVYKSEKSLIEQRQVGTHTYSFSNALRSALRQAADVILVGEMRDLETISLALTAAETGSLVLGTLHTAGTGRTINRIIDVFPASQQEQVRSMLSSSISAIIWQQLLPRSDKKGLIPACEILFSNTAISHLIRQKKVFQIPSVIETSRQEGMQNMQLSLDNLLNEGKITDSTHKEFMISLELLK